MADSSQPLRTAIARSDTLGDRWLLFLAFVLSGYAFIGKGFAYVGFPPLFVGEMAYLSGVVVLLRSRCIVSSLATLPSFFLAASMAWVLLRTVTSVQTYGIDALRDSVVVMYGGFAFIIVAILLEDPRRIDTILRYYGRFAGAFIPAIPFLFAISHFLADYIPEMPNAGAPILEVRSGEVATHLAGASVFALIGFYRPSWRWILAAVATTVMVASHGRGAMLAFVVPVVLAAIVVGKARAVARTAVVILAVVFAAITVQSTLGERRSAPSTAERSIDPQQLVDNVVSTFGQSGNAQAESTKEWRLQWWNIILADTLFGPKFWTGRGFGLNLADVDGFQDVEGRDRPKLRSPHNVHMTILARAGVPGLVLWSALLLSWFGLMLRALYTARRRGQVEWSRLFLFVACYVLSIIIDATFDVAIEGPMIGIWFWCLIGFGIGTVMVFRADSATRARSG
ncbi:O-antigen ligase family protein [Bradyrhizobium sp. NP1]|uniref:O-antigen ligase family protein n=1 Tax=Bradyrhizobium sp. NP1 TaxID=3049772 RepID=UPI0025A58716|nr:O-antigen ligase family protein [Bradyrhizobium sp. NP1]WJR77315.1 O-antigen ligase family protein [Bradyrhizobium sp. NP1]